MIRTGYKLCMDAVEQPYIEKVDVTDLEAVDWRTAKKQLRAYYLDKAAALRKVSEKDYFAAN